MQGFIRLGRQYLNHDLHDEIMVEVSSILATAAKLSKRQVMKR